MTPHISITLLRTQSDERLVAMTADGHDRAFEAIVDRYRRPLLRYARRMLHEEARAEDVVQAGLVSAWAALREGVEVRDLKPWLYRIVHNGALNAMKRPTAEPLIEASDLRPGPDTVIERREDVRRAFDGINALPERQRAALLAVAFEGRSHAEVGEELGLQDGAVRQLVSRARTSLRTAATALTPYPLVLWVAHAGGPQTDEMGARIGELVAGAGIAAGAGAGAGTVLGGGAAVKAGAVLATAGVLAVGAPKVAHVIREDSTPAPAAAEPARTNDASSVPSPLMTKGVALRGISQAGGTRATPGASTGRSGSGSHHGSSGSSGSSGREDSHSGSSGTSGSSGDDGGHHGSSGGSGRDDSRSGSSGGDDRSGSSHSGSGERSGRNHRTDDRSSGDGGSGSSGGSDDRTSGSEDQASPETSGSSGSSDDGSGSHDGGGSGSSDGGSSGGSGSSGSSGSSGTSGSSGSSGSTEPSSRERETETPTP